MIISFNQIQLNSAWTTAAVDNERVIAAVPIVMDILNIHQVRKKEIFSDESSRMFILFFFCIEFPSSLSSKSIIFFHQKLISTTLFSSLVIGWLDICF